jgi:hypothetical protein
VAGRLPTFIIAGAMRSGTSSLNSYLRDHPEVAVSRPKEVHYFDVNFDLGQEWYLGHFEGSEHATAVGEATPDYLYDLEAPGRIAAVVPGVRILLLLRDPAERAYSHYWHNVAVGKESLGFEEALAAEPERIAGGDEARAAYSYVDRGRYGPQVERLLSVIPAGQVLAQTFDDLTSDPVAVFRRTCAFIGVDPASEPASLGEQVNAFTRYRSPAVRNAAKVLPKRLRDAVGRVNRVESSEYEPLTPAMRERVEVMIGDANRDVARLTGVAASWLP